MIWFGVSQTRWAFVESARAICRFWWQHDAKVLVEQVEEVRVVGHGGFHSFTVLRDDELVVGEGDTAVGSCL